MRAFTLCCLVLLLAACAPAQTESKAASRMPAVIPAFDASALDTSADPCADFFQYACGTWNKNNPLPGDHARWGRFDELQEHNQIVLRSILEKAAARNSKRSPLEQKVGDYYSACMDEKAAETRGASALEPMMKRIDGIKDLGEALGELYVEQAFGAEGKQRTLAMVEALEKALQQDIQTLPWMTEATRQQAQIKLAAIRNKIGYPDKWRDYSKLTITPGDALANFLRAHEFEAHRQIAKIGQPVDRLEWGMTPPTVNAYYRPPLNEIVFPAGILQPPFYANQADDAVNFGGIGSVIGHELTHGFDDQGRKYDPVGNLRDWWTAEDGKAFEERAGCIADEYSSFTAIAGVKVNGRLTLGENTADNGGVRIAYMALMDRIAGKDMPKIDGFAPEQRFFLSFAQLWCQNASEEEARRRVIIDPHSPGRWRVNGVVQNNSDFAKAFSCKAGQAMVREKACRVW